MAPYTTSAEDKADTEVDHDISLSLKQPSQITFERLESSAVVTSRGRQVHRRFRVYCDLDGVLVDFCLGSFDIDIVC